jgi:hypothetical protein
MSSFGKGRHSDLFHGAGTSKTHQNESDGANPFRQLGLFEQRPTAEGVILDHRELDR